MYAGDPEDLAIPRKMTWSVVNGTQKKDMVVNDDIGVNTREITTRETIVAAVEEFLALVKRVIQMQKQNRHQEAVPVVYGSSIDIHAKDLVEGLVSHYRHELGETAALADPACVAHILRQTPGLKAQTLEKEAFKIVLQRLMKNRVQAGDLQYEIRDYAAVASQSDWEMPPNAIQITGENAAERTILTNTILGEGLRERFDAAYIAVIHQRQDDRRPELEGIIREVARKFATHGMLVRDENGKVVNRFISAATTPDLTPNSDIRNFIFLDDDLRRVYGEEFIRFAGIDHNVCFKTSLDKRNPPFADIAGTHLADQYDARDGTKPTAVMVRR